MVHYKGFLYQAASWSTARRVVAKVEFHAGELFPRVGFIVTNLELPSRAVVRFYNKRGTAEQWIKEGKLGVNWTRLSCHRFRGNEVRLWLSVIAYNLGNLWRRLALPKKIGNWSLTSLKQRLVKTGGRLVPHSGMRVITGCCWPKGISRGSVLAACFEGSRRCRSRTGSESGEIANRALRSDPVGTSVSGQAGWRQETDQTNQRNCQTSRDATRGRLCRSEIDTRGRQAYGFRVEIKLKSEIPA